MRYLTAAAALGLLLAATGAAEAVSVDLYVDSAPNVYGSPDWAPWWATTKDDVAAGAFTNMRTGTFPGTTVMSPYDEIVYSTGDLGKRLHWIYWVPGETMTNLDGKFEVKWTVDWAGTEWTLDDDGNWAMDEAELGWAAPSTRWEDYDDNMGTSGVVGSIGFAWWATDDDAPPPDTYGSPYDETDQADIDALAAIVKSYQSHALGQVRYRESPTDDWQYSSLDVQMVPEPLTMAGLILGVGSLVGYVRRRKA